MMENVHKIRIKLENIWIDLIMGIYAPYIICGGGGAGFGGSGSRLGTLFGDVSSFAAEQAEVLLKTVLSLCLCELAIFSEL